MKPDMNSNPSIPIIKNVLRVLFYPITLFAVLLIIDVATVWFMDHVIIWGLNWFFSLGFFWEALILLIGVSALYSLLVFPLNWFVGLLCVGAKAVFGTNGFTKITTAVLTIPNFIYMVYYLFYGWRGSTFWSLSFIIFALIYLSLIFTYNFSLLSVQWNEGEKYPQTTSN